MRKLSENPQAITSKRRLGYIGRMRSARLLLPAVTLTAYALVAGVAAQDRQVEVDSHLLLGEIALDRQDFPKAASEFLAAAMIADEPGPAERATRMAHQLELTEPGIQAANRWSELAPEDERPAWYLGVFETRG